MLPGLFLSAIKIMSESTEIHININLKYLAIHNVQNCVLIYLPSISLYIFSFLLLNKKWIAVEFILHHKGNKAS